MGLAHAHLSWGAGGGLGHHRTDWRQCAGLAFPLELRGVRAFFRIVWGLVGGRWSRFASFLNAPGTTLRYLRGERRPEESLEVGHGPLGALSVFGLVGILSAQVATGLFADDEISSVGPLVRFVPGAASNLATTWHKRFGQWLIIALVLLHVVAVLYDLLKKRPNLVRPMLTGAKLLGPGVPPSTDNLGSRAGAGAVARLRCGRCVPGEFRRLI